jgi:hypothetical protein
MTARMLYGFSCLLLLCGCETMNTYRSLGWEPGYDWDSGASAHERNVAMTEEFAGGYIRGYGPPPGLLPPSMRQPPRMVPPMRVLLRPPMSMPPPIGMQPPMATPPAELIAPPIMDPPVTHRRPPVESPPPTHWRVPVAPPRPPFVHQDRWERDAPPDPPREEMYKDDGRDDIIRPDAPETILKEIRFAYKKHDAGRIARLAESLLSYSHASRYQKAEAFLYAGAMYYIEGDSARAHTCFKKAVRLDRDALPDNEIRTSRIMDAFIRARADELGR